MEFIFSLAFFLIGMVIGIIGVVEMLITKNPRNWKTYCLIMWVFIGLGWTAEWLLI